MTSVWTRPSARMVGGLLAAAFLLLGGSPHCRAATPAAGDLRTPPLWDGNPVTVAISIHIINLASIDEVKQQFEIDGYLMARWIEPRLAFTPSGPNDRHRQYSRSEVWIPYVEMVNAVAPRERYDASAEGVPDGSVDYVERFHAVLSSKFMLKRFPFDSQSLLIILHPYLRQEQQVEAQRTTARRGPRANSPSIARWRNGTCRPCNHRLALRTCLAAGGFRKRALRSTSSAATPSTCGRCFCRCC